MILRGTVYSEILEIDTGISIVTPRKITAGKPYKTVYLLHGLRGNANTWLDRSMLAEHASHGSTVYIMPEAGRSFYCDMAYGPQYFSYVTQELPAICKRMFGISTAREDTGIIGVSMGGYGALKCALTYPNQYGMCAAFSSGALFLTESLANQQAYRNNADFIARFGQKLIDDFACIFGDGLQCNERDELLTLAKQAAQSKTLPQIYCTCGTEDPFYTDHLRFSAEMRALSLSFDFEDWSGGHDFAFFDTSLQKTIKRFSL